MDFNETLKLRLLKEGLRAPLSHMRVGGSELLEEIPSMVKDDVLLYNVSELRRYVFIPRQVPRLWSRNLEELMKERP